MQVIFRIAMLLKKYRGWTIFAYFCLFASAGLAVVIPKLTGRAIDLVLGEGQLNVIVLTALGIVGTSLLMSLFTFGQNYLSQSLSQKVAYDLRNTLYNHLQGLSYSFHDRSHTGQLMSRATVDVEGVRMFVGFALLRGTYFLIIIVAITFVLLFLNWKLALLSLSVMPLIALRTAVVGRRLRRLWMQVQQGVGVLGDIIHESLTGIRVVRAFSGEDFEKKRFNDQATTLYNQEMEADRQIAINNPLMNLFFILATGVTLWYGGRQVIEGGLTHGELAQFLLYLTMLSMPVRAIGWLVMLFSRAMASGQRVFSILDEVSPVQDRPEATDLSEVKGLVRFENVSFSYEAQSPTLENISFEVKTGQVVALVGATGSGKSTIANLIPRFYDVTSGRITIDDIDIKDVSLASLRRHIGIVHQETFLFSDTIKANISYGKVEATFEEIVAAARAAGLHDFITSLPEGYDTWVGERGITLSGGQKQRLAIARTILLNPRILIMDDSTSSVDMETEYFIQQALAKLLPGRTTFIIAQRLRSVQLADFILVLKEGKIVEQGTHQELISRGGFYRQLYNMQFQDQEVHEELESAPLITENRPEAPPAVVRRSTQATPSRQPGHLASAIDEYDELVFGKAYDSRVVGRLLKYLSPHKLSVAVATIGTMAYTLSIIAVPYLIGLSIDNFIAVGNLDGLNMVILLFIGTGLFSWFAYYIEIMAEARAGQGIVLSLRNQLFSHLHRLPISFFDRNSTGRIMSRVQNDVENLQDFLDSSALAVAGELFSLLGIIVALLLMDVNLALITFVIIPFLFIFFVFWQRRARRFFLQVRRAIAAVNGALQETISGVRVIQSLSREEANARRFEELNRAHLDANLGSARLSATMTPVVETLMAIATASILIFGGIRVVEGALMIGVLVAFALYIQRFFDPIRTLTMEYTELQRAMASGFRVFELLDIEPEPADPPQSIRLPAFRGEVRFENVSFSYEPGLEVLHNINLVIPAGQTIALIGRTGAGKSTIVNLIARYYDVSQGRILIDGHDLRQLERASFRQQIGMVLQDPFLFSGTIKDNIRYGRLDATEDEIVAAARTVSAHEFIMHLEKGYNTELQERGHNLSMGQRQLISFARVLVANPRIFLLDEATANIDSQTESLLQQALARVLEGRTAIVIAHRLSTVRHANRIVVLDEGKIVEEGTHSELLARGGLYARLAEMAYTSVSAH